MKIGALYVKSYPSRASIYIDGKNSKKLTPSRILNIKPGIHTIKVSKFNYSSWEKSLNIIPSETTFIRDILLFKKNLKPLFISPGGTDVVTSSDKSIYVFLNTQGNLIITNTLTGNSFEIEVPKKPIDLLQLSPSNNQILYQYYGILYTIDLNTGKEERIAASGLFSPSKVMWDQNNNTQIWALIQRKLYILDTSINSKKIYAEDIDDFYVTSRVIVTLERNADKISINMHNIETKNLLFKSVITSFDDVSISATSANGTVILAGKKSIWIVNEEKQTTPLMFDAYMFDFHNDTLLLANDFEIYYYDERLAQPELIDRTSDKINTIQWHPSGSYLLRQIDQNIQLVELDKRDRRNIVSFPQINSGDAVIFDKKGEEIFIVSELYNFKYQIQ